MIIRTESTDFRMRKNRIPIFHSPMLGGGQQEILWVGLTDKLTVKKKKKKSKNTTQHRHSSVDFSFKLQVFVCLKEGMWLKCMTKSHYSRKKILFLLKTS